jgi:nucleoid-associated protein YgaU
MADPKHARAMIVNTQSGEQIPVMYNPDEYRLEQGNTFAEIGIPGLPAPPIQYVRGRGRVLTMDLFFDTYDTREDVRRHSGRIVALLDKAPRTQAPPILRFVMGQFNFTCVLTDAGQRFTMFLPDGTPVRTVLSARFQEYRRVEVETASGFFVGPPALHNVLQNETLSGIAAAQLGDPTRWREIAIANDIDDPFRIPEGKALIIPGAGGTVRGSGTR